MEIICIDGAFPADLLAYYAEYGVIVPKEGKMYTIWTVKPHVTKMVTGILLAELINPVIPIHNHPVLGNTMMEPTWNINRFRTLAGEPIKKEELQTENVT